MFLIGCSGGSSSDEDFLPSIKIEILTELSDSPEAVQIIKSLEKSINEFSVNMETLIVENEDVLYKKNKDLSKTDSFS